MCYTEITPNRERRMLMKKLIALLLCTLLLCGCTPEAQPTEPVTDPTEAASEPEVQMATVPETQPEVLTITIYHGNANADGFETTEFEVEAMNTDVLMEKLIEVGALNEDVVLGSMQFKDGGLVLNFNDAFLAQLNTMGTSGERMMVGSVVNTFLTAFNKVDKVSILVGGQIVESGHVIYDEPMGFIE